MLLFRAIQFERQSMPRQSCIFPKGTRRERDSEMRKVFMYLVLPRVNRHTLVIFAMHCFHWQALESVSSIVSVGTCHPVAARSLTHGIRHRRRRKWLIVERWPTTIVPLGNTAIRMNGNGIVWKHPVGLVPCRMRHQAFTETLNRSVSHRSTCVFAVYLTEVFTIVLNDVSVVMLGETSGVSLDHNEL